MNAVIFKPEAGKYAKTRGGHKAFVSAIIQNPMQDKQPSYSVIGFVEGSDDRITWTSDGRFISGNEDDFDLVAEWVEPKRIKGWVNVYDSALSSESAGGVHPTKRDADEYAMPHRLACIEIDVEEGHGLGEAA